jgi:hypothetical protein
MTPPLPMLAESAVRLAVGLTVILLLTSWRLVPPRFFRTHGLVILALLVVAGLDASRAGIRGTLLYGLIAAAVAAYLMTVAWGMGLPRVAVPVALSLAFGGSTLLVGRTLATPDPRGLFESASRLASAFLLGSTLSAMLLGHYYLTAPAMSIDPLKRFVKCMGWGLVARGALASYGLWMWLEPGTSDVARGLSPLFLTVRFGVGILGVAIATGMTWQTVSIRSTQSATGILYIAMVLVLFGELTAMVLTQDSGVMF